MGDGEREFPCGHARGAIGSGESANPHAWSPDGLSPSVPDGGLMRALSPAGRPPAAGPPTTGVMWRPRVTNIPARPRGHAVGRRWPCKPIPGRWQYQRTAAPTSFPATLTWRRWRRTLPDQPPYHPPSSAGPPDWKLCGDDNRAADHRRFGSWAHSLSPPSNHGRPRGRIAGAAPRPPALRTPTVSRGADARGLGRDAQPTTPPGGSPPQVFGRRLSGKQGELVAPSPKSPSGGHRVTTAQP